MSTTSRNPEYRFVSTDTEELISKLIASYELITKTNVSSASPEMLFIRWIADVIIQERVLNNWTGNQNIPSRAQGANLDALGELFYDASRPEAKTARCTERFFISEAQDSVIPIPKGTRVTDADGTLVWETADEAYIAIGDTYADVALICMTAGTVGNGYAVGRIDKLVDISNIAYCAGCENLTAGSGGANRASDDEYYELMRMSMDTGSTAGARGTYIYFAKKVSGEIADVLPNSPEPGRVCLYILMKDNTAAGTEIKNAVLAACNSDSVRPLTDYVTVADPEAVTFDINFTYFVASRSGSLGLTSIEAAVRAAVDDYISWQCGAFGRDINPDELRQKVKATGVKRTVLTSPAFTVLRDGKDNTVPQYAAIGNVTITNGGYEDE